MGKIEGKIRYKEVFVTERGCGFDEWLPGNVNDIYMQTNSPIMLENIGADINPYKTSFETVSLILMSDATNRILLEILYLK